MEVGQFWGFPADEASRQEQACLTTEINGRQLLPISESLYPSLLCLAPYLEGPGSQYYRANIQHVHGSSVEVRRAHTHTSKEMQTNLPASVSLFHDHSVIGADRCYWKREPIGKSLIAV